MIKIKVQKTIIFEAVCKFLYETETKHITHKFTTEMVCYKLDIYCRKVAVHAGKFDRTFSLTQININCLSCKCTMYKVQEKTF